MEDVPIYGPTIEISSISSHLEYIILSLEVHFCMRK
jgi:hypothetical protein